ncbi:MAG: helix-turn-helix domain-containing protein, partial [Alphaproteobacteria bacterium]
MSSSKSPASEAQTASRARTGKPSGDSIGERLRQIRLKRNLTINGLAKLARVPASTISKIENGLLKPSLVHAINLASALQENLGFLVDRFRAEPRRTSVIYSDQRDVLEYPEMG